MTSHRSREGYLVIDHSNSPGIPAELFAEWGAKIDPATAALFGEGKTAEFATLSCSHCNTQLIRNPGRERERARCYQCFHYICDACAADYKITGCCKSLDRQFDEIVRAVQRQESSDKLFTALTT